MSTRAIAKDLNYRGAKRRAVKLGDKPQWSGRQTAPAELAQRDIDRPIRWRGFSRLKKPLTAI
jgi:hypothetical protein